MKLRVAATVLGAMAMALFAISPAQAAAKPYDHKDPYRTGCGNQAWAVKTGKIISQANGRVGTIKLMWSSKCKTNWIEIKLTSKPASMARGIIHVRTIDARHDSFSFKPGNQGRHWGNMLYAKNICAWGTTTVRWNGGRGAQKASGSAGACD
ncbi:DUF2690 domain-containing protein [Nonomuraea angiospora]|uniref:DUF2690 domain-containing protein n=1 Tax=Nonomuraea angiospora TaxID=46172 RepID=UPI0029B256E4|nr:DUF2690 domain-containing protein [Nonomuraea angiospora]MDX3104761.1 DUF2690 domain-containing protein [Nonomuraea angiospora]